MVQNDYNRVAADFENWRKQQEAAQAQALEQQRIAEEQQRAAQAAAAQQAQQQEAMRQMQEQQMQQAQAQAAMQQNAQPIPTLQQAQPTQPTPNYAEQARAIGLPWSPDDVDYVQQINDYNARVNSLKQSMAEREATTNALRQQIEANPALLEQGKQNLANDKQLNTLADQLNAFYAKQNNAAQDEAQKAYTTAVLRTQIAQNPELFANALKQFSVKSGSGKKSKKSQGKGKGVDAGTPYEPMYRTEEVVEETPNINSRYDYEQYINSKKKR